MQERKFAPVIVRNGDKFLFVVVSRQTKKMSSLRPLRLCGECPSPNLRKSAVKYLLISLRLCGEILNDSYCFSKLGALCSLRFARPDRTMTSPLGTFKKLNGQSHKSSPDTYVFAVPGRFEFCPQS